jgi:4-hydroxy-tetrahydrodipicolinate synthase
MIYDIPGRTGVRIGTPTLLRLAEHPRVVAVKEATGDLFAGSEVMARTSLAYYSGDDPLNLAWLAHGAGGVVSVVGHVAGRHYARMVEAMDAGDLAAARAVHTRLIPAVRSLMGAGSQGAIRAKSALQVTGALTHRVTRLPLLPAPAADLPSLRTALEESELL